LDFSKLPLDQFQLRFPDFPKENLHHQNFFDHDNSYDLILEQTFFCALNPELREEYSKKMVDLLNPGGKLVGVLFDRIFDSQGPPFGGRKDGYLLYFNQKFEILTYEECYNSIPERTGSELFVRLRKSKI
jgi:SAM-dependent methyltransferase